MKQFLKMVAFCLCLLGPPIIAQAAPICSSEHPNISFLSFSFWGILLVFGLIGLLGLVLLVWIIKKIVQNWS